MFLSGVEESAAIAEVGDSGGLSKIAGRPVREARPKAADVRRGRRREKAGRVGRGKQSNRRGRSGVEWQGRAGTLLSPSPLHPACRQVRYTPRSCARRL